MLCPLPTRLKRPTASLSQKARRRALRYCLSRTAVCAVARSTDQTIRSGSGSDEKTFDLDGIFGDLARHRTANRRHSAGTGGEEDGKSKKLEPAKAKTVPRYDAVLKLASPPPTDDQNTHVLKCTPL